MIINHRRLIWLEFDSDTEALEAINQLRVQLSLDRFKGLMIGKPYDGFATVAADRMASELGQSIDYLLFNAFDGFTPNALAQGVGLIRASGLLILITPNTSLWPCFPDPFLLGLGQSEHYKSNYINLLINYLNANSHSVNDIDTVSLKGSNEILTFDSIDFTEDQQSVVNNLLDDWSQSTSTRVITADRGRGKSSSLGYALQCSDWAPNQVIVTAPDKRSVYSLYQQCGDVKPRFLHPAEALQELHNNPAIQLLVIDEAAAIATPLLDQLVEHVNHLAVSTTVNGYEGFGRGFSLRFLERLGLQREGVSYSQLDEPVRWSQGDQLEATINDLLFLTDCDHSLPFSEFDDGVHHLNLEQLINQPDQLNAIYQLLHFAHYRTSPNDLRVLLDSPGQLLFVSIQSGELVGVTWISKEGELSADLTEEIAQGKRRPNGNLIPQTLVFSEGMVSLGVKRFWRVTRIAVVPDSRRSGIAASMLRTIEVAAAGLEVDFIGASFAGYQEVWQFWESSGYAAIRIGDRIDPVAGEPALLVLKALNAVAAEDLLFINQQTTCRYQFEIERGLRSAMPMGFNEMPDCKDQEVLSSHQIDALKRFAFGNAPLALVRPWIERLERVSTPYNSAHLEPNPNKKQTKVLRQRVALLIKQFNGIS